MTRQNGRQFSDRFVPMGPINSDPALVQIMGLAPNRWDAIISTSDGLVYWCVYMRQSASMSKAEIRGVIQQQWPKVSSTNMDYLNQYWISRADSRFAPSQRERLLQSNAVSHWLGANLESALNKAWHPGGRLNKKDGLTRYGDSHVKDKTS